MSSSRPFFTSPSGELDRGQILNEVRFLARLIGAVVLVALVPVVLQLLLVELLGAVSVFGFVLTLVTQFVLAVGTALVLIYVVVRANQLTGE
ncbi:hypothetical protein [Haloarchaeobius sp. HRN-SO-5]|uniref:hypothetical protein n=1 Tax=Haloarchaeobius sp. HRN-SO-5 TaxID=3446118 RepID=UPI003EBF6E31